VSQVAYMCYGRTDTNFQQQPSKIAKLALLFPYWATLKYL
jgi:hypothetical protein